MAAIVECPDAGFPKAMADEAGLEGVYRFMNNGRVTPQAILEPHVSATCQRAGGLNRVLVVHDTTEFAYPREQPPDDMGRLQGSKRGFQGHVSLALDPARGGLPLGLLGLQTLNRTGPYKGRRSNTQRLADPERESRRWLRGVTEASQRLPDAVQTIHVMDREADFYECFAHVLAQGDDFVIRIQHDRQVAREASESPMRLFQALEGLEVRLTRSAQLSRRGRGTTPSQRKNHPPRAARKAHLEATAGGVSLARPGYGPESWPARIEMSAIHIRELDPPEGAEAMDWKLLTTLPVATAEQVSQVLDYYLLRWTIEEYFKALKTGCAFLKRQFDSMAAILNVLAVLAPVAWSLLVLRDFGRSHPDLPATVALTPAQIQVLAVLGRRKLTKTPTLGEVMWAVAALGGHLKRNGPPGWQTLARGLKDLKLLTRGWHAARCDQS